jgi:transmembrane sensor
LAAAAAVCVVAIGISWSFWPTPTEPPPAQVYETARAQPREVALADGSKIHLNGASKLEVRFEPGRRTAVLDKGEAAFEVAHDTARPFLIAAGDRTVRVVGTQFNVLRHEGDLTVTVREGIVTVGGQDDPAPTDVRLAAGQQLRHHEGASSSEVTKVEPDDAFAWRRGVLVYHDRPLSEVSADLDRYVATPVRVDPSAVGIRFTGVLRVDTEEAMVKRLETFLPITAERTDNEIRLRARARP